VSPEVSATILRICDATLCGGSMDSGHIVLYKLALAADVPDDAWKTRLNWTTAFVGDKSTKFISVYTADQLAGVAGAFEGKSDVMVLSFCVETMEQEADMKIKFEAAEAESGGAGAFAHCYGGPIPYACLYAAPALLPLADGKLVFPPLGPMGSGDGRAGYKEEDSEASGTDDGMEAFDQNRFDEDD